MNFILENYSIILEVFTHLAYLLALAAAVTCALIYRDMYKTTIDDLKALRNTVYALSNDPEIDATASKKIGHIYREISDLIRSL
ncbi:MAG: hypothetical protein IJW78_04885 [Clostridia bacterium]|nr:hypothetical protein [Clostridia bacterium]